MPRQVRTPMTALDRGLAIAARRAGMNIEEIAEVFYREVRTIQKLMQRYNVKKPSKEVRRAFKKSDAWNQSKRYPRIQKGRRIVAAVDRNGARSARDDGRREEIRSI